MLAYVLAFLVGLGSLALYLAAFFFPEVHRKNDFIWSGVGVFYALVLWVCAGRITGGVLLGQIAGVALLGWLGWQTFLLRRQVAPVDQQTPLPTGADVRAAFGSLSNLKGRSQLGRRAAQTLGHVKDGIGGAITSATGSQRQPHETAEELYVPLKLEEFGTAGEEAIDRFAKAVIPDDTAANSLVQKTVDEAVSEAIEQVDDAADAMTSAVKDAASAIEASQKQSPGSLSNLSQRATNTIKVFSETVQSLIQGLTKKKESKPVYIRKEYRQDSPTRAKSQVAVTDATVVEVIEEVAATTKAEGERVSDVAIEIISDDLAPDLLATTLSDVSAAEIVEDLLEDISAQEEMPEATPPHAPSQELVEQAIADAEEKGLPYDPPASEKT